MIDSDLQRAAVGALLERGDARSWALLQQIRLVENQLAMLTNIELDRRKLEMDQHMVSISIKSVLKPVDFCKERTYKYIRLCS